MYNSQLDLSQFCLLIFRSQIDSYSYSYSYLINIIPPCEYYKGHRPSATYYTQFNSEKGQTQKFAPSGGYKACALVSFD